MFIAGPLKSLVNADDRQYIDIRTVKQYASVTRGRGAIIGWFDRYVTVHDFSFLLKCK